MTGIETLRTTTAGGNFRKHNVRRVRAGLCLALGLAAGTAGAGSGRPGWAERYLEHPPEVWTEWRNSLKPEGEAVTLPLAAEGKTAYVIVVPEKATAQERRSADELRLWLGKITGAEFPIVPDTEAPRERELSVGNTSRVTEAARAKSASVGEHGYAIAVDGERLFLLGEGGPLNAVMALLEEDLGVRWYAPGESLGSWHRSKEHLEAESWGDAGVNRVPRASTLNAEIVPRAVKPAIPVRSGWWMYTFNPWGLRNRHNGGYDLWHGYQRDYVGGDLVVHTFHALVPPKQYFESNPEFYSLINGERRWKRAQLCLSNPEAAKAAARTAVEALRRAPATHRLVGVSPMDWLGNCECEDCKAIEQETGAYSGLLLTFVNRVAEEVAKEVPDATVGTLAYWQSRQPPAVEMKLHDNVAVWFCLDRGSSFDWPYHSYYDDKFGDPSAVKPDAQAPGGSWTTMSERDLLDRWREIAPRLDIWMYPTQYVNSYAPMPVLRVLGENLRYLAGHDVEMVYMQSPGSDYSRMNLNQWVIAKLMWNPGLDVQELIQDFIWGGYYGDAAAEVAEYHHLFTGHAARHNDFERRRYWIYSTHDEEMFRHGFVEQAREILGRALAAAENDAVRGRVEFLKLGTVFVEASQLFIQMREGREAPDVVRYEAVRQELADLVERLGVDARIGWRNFFYDGSQRIGRAADFVAAMERERALRFDGSWLPMEAWGDWRFRKDPDNAGVEQKWFAQETAGDEAWQAVTVPAHLSRTEVGPYLGFGWYRVTFTLEEAQARQGIEIHFGGVDEQAWVYVNGVQVGEHTLESEWMEGQEITVYHLWNRPFRIAVPAERLKPGRNVLVVRKHSSVGDGGIHRPVRISLPEPEKPDHTRGEILHEDFSGAEAGGIPAGWRRYVQVTDDGRVHGIAEVRKHGARPTLHLRDQRSHVTVWSASDALLPEDKDWVLQLDFRLLGRDTHWPLTYQASPDGGLIGLKRGSRDSRDYLPLLQLANGGKQRAPVTLYGMGGVLTENLAPNTWHRVAIRRRGTDWEFHLNGVWVKTVRDVDSDLRGLAFGSFRDWHNVMRDVEIADLKIGKGTECFATRSVLHTWIALQVNTAD